jgi:hypothetical protein
MYAAARRPAIADGEGPMSSMFDKLKDAAGKLAREHPEQVKKGEQAAQKQGKKLLDKKFGGQQSDDGSGGGQGQGR